MVTSCDVTEKTLLTSPPALASQSKLYVDFILSNVNRRFTMKLSRGLKTQTPFIITTGASRGNRTGYWLKPQEPGQSASMYSRAPQVRGYGPSRPAPDAPELPDNGKVPPQLLWEFHETVYVQHVAQHLANVSQREKRSWVPQNLHITGWPQDTELKRKLLF